MIEPDVISLDLDDTLWPVAPVIAAAESALLAWLQRHHPQAASGHDVDSMRRLGAGVAERHPERRHDLTFLRRRALHEQLTAAGYPGTAVDAAMEVFLAERNRVRLYDDVRPALARLRLKYRLFSLSNGNASPDRCGIGHFFEGHVAAAHAGAAKPDARIFEHLARVAGVQPVRILHVGDDPLTDVVGATRAGMQAAWLNRNCVRWPDQYSAPPCTVTTLADLLAADAGEC
ncbi:MAG: HAD-IA family hydrolase [Pseudomonadota bacterium]|nr:HAD-IA family hydrolase [Pseudomonadota bacterium]